MNRTTFLQHLDRSGECWLWTGRQTDRGYGTLWADKGMIPRSGHVRAHIAAYQIFVGPIPEGKQINHRCNTRLCCRPEHLYIGDQKQNAKDRDESGTTARGERNGRTYLTAEQVQEIRQDPRIYREIATDYGASKAVVTDIKLRRTWAWLPEVEG